MSFFGTVFANLGLVLGNILGLSLDSDKLKKRKNELLIEVQFSDQVSGHGLSPDRDIVSEKSGSVIRRSHGTLKSSCKIYRWQNH